MNDYSSAILAGVITKEEAEDVLILESLSEEIEDKALFIVPDALMEVLERLWHFNNKTLQ